MSLLPFIVIGGVAYELVEASGKAIPGPGQPGYLAPNFGSSLGQVQSGSAGQSGYGYDQYIDNQGQTMFGSVPMDDQARQKVDLLQVAVEKGYQALDSGGRAAAAAQLNQQLDLDPPLTGNDTWETVARVAGGAGGAAVCDVTGIGASVTPLCAMAGAYLGVKLEDWMAQSMPAIQSWIQDNIVGGITDAAHAVEDWFSNIF